MNPSRKCGLSGKKTAEKAEAAESSLPVNHVSDGKKNPVQIKGGSTMKKLLTTSTLLTNLQMV